MGGGAVRWVGRTAERVMDSALFDFVTENWFDRRIDNHLDRSNSQKAAAQPVYLDADGNRLPTPPSDAPGNGKL